MLYTAYMWTLIVMTTLILGSVLAVLLPVASKGPIYNFITQNWGKVIVRLSGTPITIYGADKLDPSVPYIYMSNHQSYFDVICEAGYLPHRVRFVAKKELVYIPLFGLLLWGTGHVIINRKKSADAVAELKKAGDKIRSGISILVFPEGTRSPDHRLGEFKKGGFMLALEAKVPVVPVSVTGTHPMMPKGGWSFKSTSVTITIGDPIDVSGFEKGDREKLMNMVRAAIISNFPEGTAEREANKDDAVL